LDGTGREEKSKKKSETKSGSWEMLGAVCERCRGESEQAAGGRTKAGKRTEDESGCRWRGRKESHETLGRFVGPRGESRGPRCGGSWNEEADGQSEGGGKESDGGAIGVVVCGATEKGGRVDSWNTGGSEERKLRERRVATGGGSRHADPPEAPRNPGGRFK